MTCAHVLGLIDAGPFADYSSAHRAAAWEHARQCATCGPALEAMTALTTDLSGLAQPAAPPDLAAAVFARLARLEDPYPVPAAAEPATRALSGTRGWSAWATALGGLAAGLVVAVSMATADGALGDIASRRAGSMTAGLLALSSTTAWALALAASLSLYVAGLFAPLGAKGKR
jgi:hypothetical protein